MDDVTAMPDCSIMVGPDGTVAVDWRNGSRLCADHGTPHCLTCPTLTSLYMGIKVKDVHLAAMVGYIADQAHEALEWIRFGGRRFAAPHVNDCDEWDFLASRIARMMRDYRRRFPVAGDSETQP